jgi:hypothetical protein
MADSAREIENLLYTYAERIDRGDLEGLADLFAHGCILPSPSGSRATAIEGRDGVLAMYRAVTRLYPDGTPRTRHVTTNAIIEVDDPGGTASARSSYTVLQQTDLLTLQPIICGRYHDAFVRDAGGWRFADRLILSDLIGDLSRHLRRT